MGDNQISQSRKICNTRFILLIILLLSLTVSSIYLFIQNNRQKELILKYEQCINILKKKSKNKYFAFDFNNQIDSLFSSWLFPLSNFFSDIEVRFPGQYQNFYKKNGNFIVDSELEYIVNVSLAGFTKEEVMIKLLGNHLEISAEHCNRDTKDKEEKNVDTNPKKYSNKIVYNITIPNDIDSDNITANFNNGLLIIKFPKITDKSLKSKEILIN